MDISQTPNFVCQKIVTCLSFLLNLIFIIFSNGSHFAYSFMGLLFFDFIIIIFIYSGINQKKFNKYSNSIILLLIKTILFLVVFGFLSQYSSQKKTIYFIIYIVYISFLFIEITILCSEINKIKELSEDKTDTAQIPIQNLNNQPLVS